MTIKLGNTEINAVSVVEPYGDDIVRFPDNDTITTWERPSHWIDMPVINSGEQKCAFLLAIGSGESLSNYFKFYARGIDPPGNIHTDFTVNWGDGSQTSVNTFHSRYAGDPLETQQHKFNFDDLPISTQFEEDGILYRQSLVVFEAPLSGIQIFQQQQRSITGGYNVHPRNILEYNINLPSIYSIGGNIYGSYKYPFLEKARIFVPSVTNLAHHFANTPKLKSIEIGPFNNLTECRGMFSSCGLEQVPSGLDVSNATVVNGLFQNSKLKKYNNELNFSSTTSLNSVFNNCDQLKSLHIDLPSNINGLSSTFAHCDNLLVVSGDWSLANLQDLNSSFYESKKLRYVPNIDFSSATSTRRMFYGCNKFKKHLVVNAPNVSNAEYMFHGCSSMISVTIQDLSKEGCKVFGLLQSCSSLKSVKVINPVIRPDSQGVSNFCNACTSLEYFPHIDTSTSTNFNGMFNGCVQLRKVENFNASSGIYFGSTFYNCKKLKKSPINDVSTNPLDNVYCHRMFQYCSELEEIPDLDFSRVYYSREMFAGCNNTKGVIKSLNLSNHNLSTTTDVNATYNMFSSCGFKRVEELIMPSASGNIRYLFNSSKIQEIPYVSASGGYNYQYIFDNCFDLTKGALSGVDVSTGYYRTGLPSGEFYKLIQGLASGVTGQTLRLEGSPEAYILHPDTIAIATSKGWTVTT